MTFNQRHLRPGERIRVLVVDDSAVVRRLVTQALSGHASIEVVGTASNGVLALQRIQELSPDVVTLDIEMPDMDGLETLRQIRRNHASPRVIMFSTLTERGASITLEALTLGADDYVAKTIVEHQSVAPIAKVQEILLPKILQFFVFSETRLSQPPSVAPVVQRKSIPTFPPAAGSAPKVVLIGVSTGGPTALAQILPTFPKDFALPILIVQHMPPLFTRLLAERLNATCNLRVVEAEQGLSVTPGNIYIAPGDFHMSVSRAGNGVAISLDQSAPQNFCRPAVDVLFSSAADVYGGAAIATILTGMGQDGLKGSELLRARGSILLAQDEETSVVWGMPGAVVNSGLANRVLPLSNIVPDILQTAGHVGGAQ